MDAALHLAPLVSPLGFQGAPSSFARVRRHSAVNASPAAASAAMQVDAELTSGGGINFVASVGDALALFVLDGLELGSFDTNTLELLRVTPSTYELASTAVPATTAPWVVAIGPVAQSSAAEIGARFGNGPACTWVPGKSLDERPPQASVVLVVGGAAAGPSPSEFAPLLPSLQYDLPQFGRVWLVVVGGSARWLGAARHWAARFPGLQLSVLHAPLAVGAAWDTRLEEIHRAVLSPHAPPHLESGTQPFALDSFRLERPLPVADAPSTEAPADDVARFAGLELRGTVAVLAFEAQPLARAIVRALLDRGAAATLILPNETPPAPAPAAVLLCGVGAGPDAAWMEPFYAACAAAAQCVTICEADVLLPTASPTFEESSSASATAAAASRRRAASGHASWIVYAPPLMEGLWFVPPAPAGAHRRYTVSSFVKALADAPAADALAGSALVHETLPKHWRHSAVCAPLRAGSSA
eukprot:819710-Prymnesium_polylepis.1